MHIVMHIVMHMWFVVISMASCSYAHVFRSPTTTNLILILLLLQNQKKKGM